MNISEILELIQNDSTLSSTILNFLKDSKQTVESNNNNGISSVQNELNSEAKNEVAKPENSSSVISSTLPDSVHMENSGSMKAPVEFILVDYIAMIYNLLIDGLNSYISSFDFSNYSRGAYNLMSGLGRNGIGVRYSISIDADFVKVLYQPEDFLNLNDKRLYSCVQARPSSIEANCLLLNIPTQFFPFVEFDEKNVIMKSETVTLLDYFFSSIRDLGIKTGFQKANLQLFDEKVIDEKELEFARLLFYYIHQCIFVCQQKRSSDGKLGEIALGNASSCPYVHFTNVSSLKNAIALSKIFTKIGENVLMKDEKRSQLPLNLFDKSGKFCFSLNSVGKDWENGLHLSFKNNTLCTYENICAFYQYIFTNNIVDEIQNRIERADRSGKGEKYHINYRNYIVSVQNEREKMKNALEQFSLRLYDKPPIADLDAKKVYKGRV